MAHEHWNEFMTIAAIFGLAVTVTGVSCFSYMFGIYAVLGILAGGGAAWIHNRSQSGV